MKALTITQPWATLIALGAKKYETRSWTTSYRGPLAIHAGKGLGPVGGVRRFEDLCAREPFRSALFGEGLYRDPSELPRGRIVATCQLVECIESPGWPPPGCPTPEEEFGDWTGGRFAWEMRGVAREETPPIRGALGLWTPPCISHNPFADLFCEKPTGHDGLHEADGKTWNWGDS